MCTINDGKSMHVEGEGNGGDVTMDEGGKEMAQNGGSRTEHEEQSKDDVMQSKEVGERKEEGEKQTDMGANLQNSRDATVDDEHPKGSDINSSYGIEIGGEKEKENDEIKEVSMEESESKTEKSYEDSDEEEDMKKRRSYASKAKASMEEDDKDDSRERRTPVTSTERPVRERKSVDRLVTSMKRDEVKDIVFEQGPGTPLKDIPNVAYKLSKRKVDETLKMLHIVLFGRRGKLLRIKSNISRFSGFVWHENEENQKAKIKEKLDKWNKDKLSDACYVLDVPVVKAGTRKEDIITKLFDFLIAPHPTTTVLLAEKEQSSKAKKRKKMSKSGASSSGKKRTVKRKSKNISKVEEKGSVVAEEDQTYKGAESGDSEDNSLPEKLMDGVKEQSEGEQKDEESEYEFEEENAKKRRKSRSSSKKTTSAERDGKKTRTPKESSAPSKKVSRKKKSEEAAPKSTPTQKSGKDAAKVTTEADQPTDDELRSAICEILKEVDFNTATFTDILKRLCTQFNTDLMPRKASVKHMIQDELTKLADEDDDDDDDDDDEGDGNGDGDNDGMQPPSNEIATI